MTLWCFYLFRLGKSSFLLTGLHTSHAEVHFGQLGYFCVHPVFQMCCSVCVSCVCSFAQIPNLKVMKISLGTSSVTAVAFHHALPQLWI